MRIYMTMSNFYSFCISQYLIIRKHVKEIDELIFTIPWLIIINYVTTIFFFTHPIEFFMLYYYEW
ncbi:Uncharacterised protein [Enterobacter hormaechei]|nr:Uncharacterised protein [Enterobacter hormaechei]